jgi:hypothetical protein
MIRPPLLAIDPGVLDMGGVDVNVIHGRGDPGMTQGLLDRDQVHPAQVKLRGVEMPQHMPRDQLRPVRQVPGRRGGQVGPQRLVACPRRAPVGVAPLGAEQRGVASQSMRQTSGIPVAQRGRPRRTGVDLVGALLLATVNGPWPTVHDDGERGPVKEKALDR